MAGKLSSRAQVRLATLGELQGKVQRVYGLVEQFAAARSGQDALSMSMKRGFAQLKRDFMGTGFDSLSQLAGAMEVASGRGTSPQVKTRILREGIGSMKFQIEFEMRMTISDDARAKEEAENKEER